MHRDAEIEMTQSLQVGPLQLEFGRRTSVVKGHSLVTPSIAACVIGAVAGFYLFQAFSGPDLVRLWWLWATMYAVAAAAVVLAAGANLGGNRLQRRL